MFTEFRLCRDVLHAMLFQAVIDFAEITENWRKRLLAQVEEKWENTPSWCLVWKNMPCRCSFSMLPPVWVCAWSSNNPFCTVRRKSWSKIYNSRKLMYTLTCLRNHFQLMLHLSKWKGLLVQVRSGVTWPSIFPDCISVHFAAKLEAWRRQVAERISCSFYYT